MIAPIRPPETAKSRVGAAAHTNDAHTRAVTDRVIAPAANHAPKPLATKAPRTTRFTAICMLPTVKTMSGLNVASRGSEGADAPSPSLIQPEVQCCHSCDQPPCAGRRAPPVMRPFVHSTETRSRNANTVAAMREIARTDKPTSRLRRCARSSRLSSSVGPYSLLRSALRASRRSRCALKYSRGVAISWFTTEDGTARRRRIFWRKRKTAGALLMSHKGATSSCRARRGRLLRIW